MPTDEADPIALTPDPRSDRDLGVELHTHLKIPLEIGLWDRKRMGGGGGGALKAIDHCIEISFLGRFRWRMLGGAAIDCLMKDGIVRIVLLHRIEVGRAFEEMGALTASVFGAD